MLQATPMYGTGIKPTTPSRQSWVRRRSYTPIGARVTGFGYLGATTGGIVISATQMTGGILTTTAVTAGHLWGMTAAVAVPVIGAVVAGVTIGLTALFSRKGPKQKVATTQIVDKVEPLLAQNRDGYLAGPRTYSSQQQAIENFKAGWQFVVDHCGIPEMGDPGQRCISERQRGGQWDWFSYYLDPIQNDPEVQPDPIINTETGEIFGLKVAGGSTGLLIAGGLVLAAVALGGGS